MEYLSKSALAQLGSGQSIDSICRAIGITRPEFLERWKCTAESRVPRDSGLQLASVDRPVEICRNRQGVPHIFAESDSDLFFGFGYAVAQDRLFQLDWLRRKGAGRLSEILGTEGLPQDILARTVGLHRIAEAEWEKLPSETRSVLTWFSQGVNALIEHSGDTLPIEFDLLDYRPEPWRPVDCLLIENEFRWYLTGRFPVIAVPELAKQLTLAHRRVGDKMGFGACYEAFLTAEADDESILRPGDLPRWGPPISSPTNSGVGESVSDPDASVGSNNWVIDGKRSASGRPTVASDPHIAIEAVSCWYSVHLQGGSFDVAGCAYVGMPAVLIGRNRHMAWGITNNICSQRDLYREDLDPDYPGCFLRAGKWEPAEERWESIEVRGQAPVLRQVVSSHFGPNVDDLLPALANRLGAVSLRWLGAEHGGWLTALLGANRARNYLEFRESLRPWHVPTFSVVFADVDGNIGYHATGRIPLRRRAERGFRQAFDPADEWDGLIQFDDMPAVINPQRGFIVTANNRVVGNWYGYPLSGTWTSGHRARRIREVLESQPTHTLADHRRLQQDACSLRAVACLPNLCTLLASSERSDVQRALALLRAWNGDCLPELAAPTIFNVFFVDWCHRVATERFDARHVPFLTGGIEGLAAKLLQNDPPGSDPDGWFARDDCGPAIRETFGCTLDRLAERFGPNIADWSWGRLHRLEMKHFLAGRGDLGLLLNQGGVGVRGDATTVCNTGRGPDFEAATGAGFRMICDLGESPAGLWVIDAQSQSGHIGSQHYRDQFQDWIGGEYHFVPLDRQKAAEGFTAQLRLMSTIERPD
ncbi:MAG TPA: penicillin acylase family protein [Planctomycetaceae bacterium]|jgi:penicillin amidase|nr:penicillin acylase family protein [Planctomycetaceae bacterium]